ncbi:unnamed protein product [Chondrus crispus]|uniref:Protease Do-like PDZ domain-containing protein n=1 Tax=Chondrus crispus TaxID=2769 RepID=R7QB01_CHOCR|nr:unnamed protein product [Chondrus crispus]CDF34586.1 unnamed protein product [Chondrus crispus]|eukprot:XP_005714405.1 unnamed protein product [Chondrus crispus]
MHPSTPPTRLQPHHLDAVVHIFADVCLPSHSQPWHMHEQTAISSSGFLIAPHTILTTAHAILSRLAVVRVKKRTTPQKYLARVIDIAHDCDLALLTVDDTAFAAPFLPIPSGPLPALQQNVYVVGYPSGGHNICISAGVVSRIHIKRYEQAKGMGYLLTVQVDAAINSGNSGGPALDTDNRVVGIAFESAAGSSAALENVGYLVPVSVINHFLCDVEQHGRFRGFCDYGFMWQRMDSPALRRYFTMSATDTGILVCDVKRTAPVSHILRRDDIITHIEDVAISNAGTVPVDFAEPLPFHYLISNKRPGDKARLRVLRDGSPLRLEYKLCEASEHVLVPVRELRAQPEYYIIAGIVFVVLTIPYLEANFGVDWATRAPPRLAEITHNNRKEFKDQQVVVVAQVLSSEIILADCAFHDSVVTKVNGTVPKNLNHLVSLVHECKEAYVRLELDGDFVVVVDLEEAKVTAQDIMTRHAIPAEQSLGDLVKQSSSVAAAETTSATASQTVTPP